MEDNDPQLQLKKRARRRLVGAVAFAGLAAVVLPMIMDQEPKPATQDVEIRIPGQDEKPFAPKFAAGAAAKPAAPVEVKATEVAKAAAPSIVAPVPKPAEKLEVKVDAKPAIKAPEKAPEKPVEKSPPKPAEKPIEKPSAAPVLDAQRAAAILAGKSPETPVSNGQHVILIGAFNNQTNVKNLQKKLSELDIKNFTEPLDTPQGKKTRVRAGPFASRDAAEKALEKMKRIGVVGVMTTK